MDTNKSASDADNHNTNQNEAACASRCLLAMDGLQKPKMIAQDIPPEHGSQVNMRNDSGLFQVIPAIIITPASPEVVAAQTLRHQQCYDKEGSLIDNPKDVVTLLDDKLLTVPLTDTTINIRRPTSSDGECTHRQISCEGVHDDESEMRCRYSSTPVMPNVRRTQNLDASDCSIISLGDASPIVPDDSMIVTPNRSTNRSIPRDDDNAKDLASPHQNILYVHPPYLDQAQGQAMTRWDMQASQNTQPSYMNGRVLDPGYMASTSVTGGSYTGVPNVYPTYMEGTGCYNDYFPARDSSWTDLSYRSDTSPVPQVGGPHVDGCCYPTPSAGSASSEYFVYPSIYVSSSGLISVLLRNDMSVEMTVDRTIRVVSHNNMMAVATDSRGTAACLYHPAVKVFQIGTTTDIATLNFRARMGGEVIVFSNGVNFFKLEDSELQPTAPIKFTDIFRDQSVNLLFSSEGYGESLVASCMQVAAQAEYANLPKGGVIVRINGVKVTQTGGGDVTVVTGAKFIRLSPHFGTTRLGNRFVDIEVEKDWTVKLTRGSHSFVCCKKRAMVCNGKMEAGFDENNGLKVTNLQLRLPLLAEPSMVRRACRKQVRIPSTSGTPKRRPGPSGSGRGSGIL